MAGHAPPRYHSSCFRIVLAVVSTGAALQLTFIIYLHQSLPQPEYDGRVFNFSTFANVSLSQENNIRTLIAINGSRPFISEKKDYDAAAPNFIKDCGRCHFLPSIPSHRRTPPHLVTDLQYFQDSRAADFEDSLYFGLQDERPLYVYNPSIISLRHMEQVMKDDITGKDFDLTLKGVQAFYLASFRVSTHASCFGPLSGSPPEYTRNYLGLALLDENMDIITDIVTDINYWQKRASFGKSKRGNERPWWMSNFSVRDKEFYVPVENFVDCRLIMATAMPHQSNASADSSGFESKQGLYMSCNAYLIPITVHRTRRSDDTKPPSINDIRNQGFSKAIVFPNLFGDGLRLSFLDKAHKITAAGKNFNFFSALNNKVDESPEYYVQLWPGGPHEVRRVNFLPQGDKRQFVPFKKGIAPIVSKVQEPNATWLEPEFFGKLLYNFHKRDRGGACCIQIIPHIGGRSLYVGVTHTKTVLRGTSIGFQYVSRLYAYEMVPPFNAVAKTGYFCLGFGKRQESRENPLVGFNEEFSLHLNKRTNRTYQCPSISFVSGISEHATNPSLVILSYGVNDCYSRMGIIEKDEIIALLFPQFYASRLSSLKS